MTVRIAAASDGGFVRYGVKEEMDDGRGGDMPVTHCPTLCGALDLMHVLLVFTGGRGKGRGGGEW